MNRGFSSFDSVVEAVLKIDEGIGRPQALLKFVPRNNVTPAFKQYLEDVERLVLKLDPDAVFAQFACAQIQLENVEADRFLD